MKNRLLLILISFMLTGCGIFSSGLLKDILKAQDYITEQKFDKAVKIYETLLLKKPPKTIQIKINFQLGEIYSIYLDNPTRGLSHFKTIVYESNEPAWQVKALEKMGNIYFEELKEYRKAERIYAKLTAFKPTLEKFNYYRFRNAESILNQQRYTHANKLFNEILIKDKSKYGILAHYYIGLSNFYLKNWDQAIDHFKKYADLEKRQDLKVNTIFLIANAYESSERLKEAYNYYYSIQGDYPNPEIIKNRLNSLYERRVARKR